MVPDMSFVHEVQKEIKTEKDLMDDLFIVKSADFSVLFNNNKYMLKNFEKHSEIRPNLKPFELPDFLSPFRFVTSL